MQSNQTPTLIPLAWAQNGTKNAIPEASQITITPGAASLNDGFPPICAIKVAAGGIAPAYGDFNGVFNLITQSIRWAHGGGRYAFSSTFAADANVSGYPAGAMLMSADTLGSWISLNDANTDDPDTGAGTKWVPGHQYGVTPITGLTNANVTLTPAQAAKSKITLAGTLTGNLQLVFPAWTKEWEIVNNTTGSFTITAKTAAGSGVALAAGQQKITGDGTNITQPAESIAAATLPTHAMQLGQATGRLLNVQHFVTAGSTTYVQTPGTTEIVVVTAGGGALGASTLATTGTQIAVGGGGGAGGFAVSRLTGGFNGAAITIGAGGTVGSPNGGTSSFGAFLSATGGTAGPSSNTAQTPPFVSIGGLGGVGSGGNIANGQGGQGLPGIGMGAASFVSGAGGTSYYGAGGYALATQTNTGSASASAGGGGAGALAGGSTAAQSGGAGGPGAVIVYEYS